MFDGIRNLFRTASSLPPSAIPDGERVYAVGDIHGRLDLFETLLTSIEEDDRVRGETDTTIILLGDLIDRGPDSAGVIAAARALAARRKTRLIAGNHEEMLLESLERCDTLRHFLRYGGRETVLSYPVRPDVYHELDIAGTQALMHEIIPAADLDFLRDAEDLIEIGNYLFVHAGIRPGRALEQQATKDLRWIREPFLNHAADHGWCVVHGHTISEEVEIMPNRIGIDTGAFMSGRLTALGLDGTQRWLIEARETGSGIAASQRDI